MNDLRFASLRGASRRYIDEWDVDDLDEFVFDSQGGWDPALDDDFPDDDLLAGYADPPHDGWSEIRPLHRAMQDVHARCPRRKW